MDCGQGHTGSKSKPQKKMWFLTSKKPDYYWTDVAFPLHYDEDHLPSSPNIDSISSSENGIVPTLPHEGGVILVLVFSFIRSHLQVLACTEMSHVWLLWFLGLEKTNNMTKHCFKSNVATALKQVIGVKGGVQLGPCNAVVTKQHITPPIFTGDKQVKMTGSTLPTKEAPWHWVYQ